MVMTALLSACGGDSSRRPAPAQRAWPVVSPTDPVRANAVLMRAISLVGTPYRYGGNTPDSGFDCSGLVNYVYRDMLDLRLPRTSRDLAAWQGPRIAPERLAAADLVFFASGGKRQPCRHLRRRRPLLRRERRHGPAGPSRRQLLARPLQRLETGPELRPCPFLPTRALLLTNI
jgi:hypothetical protein